MQHVITSIRETNVPSTKLTAGHREHEDTLATTRQHVGARGTTVSGDTATHPAPHSITAAPVLRQPSTGRCRGLLLWRRECFWVRPWCGLARASSSSPSVGKVAPQAPQRYKSHFVAVRATFFWRSSCPSAPSYSAPSPSSVPAHGAIARHTARPVCSFRVKRGQLDTERSLASAYRRDARPSRSQRAVGRSASVLRRRCAHAPVDLAPSVRPVLWRASATDAYASRQVVLAIARISEGNPWG
jgi:hypothetical protein